MQGVGLIVVLERDHARRHFAFEMKIGLEWNGLDW